MEHLDRGAVQAILRGDPEAMARYGAHLEQSCEVCETLLMEEDVSPELEGEVDRLLLGTSPLAEAPLDELGFRRVQQRLSAGRSRAPWTAISALAAVLVVGAFGIVAFRGTPNGDVGIKGVRRISVELQVAVRGADGALRRVDPATSVARGEGVLLLRYHATELGTAVLLRQHDAEPPEVLGSFDLEPGTHDLASPDGLAGVPVPEVRGTLRLWLVASPSPEPPTDDEALAALDDAGASPFAVTEVGLEVR